MRFMAGPAQVGDVAEGLWTSSAGTTLDVYLLVTCGDETEIGVLVERESMRIEKDKKKGDKENKNMGEKENWRWVVEFQKIKLHYNQ